MSSKKDKGKTFNEEIETLRASFAAMGGVIVTGFKEVLEETEKTMGTLREHYREHGTVYGDTHQGLMHWLADIAKLHSHRTEIEQIVSDHAALAAMHKERSKKGDKGHDE